MNDWRREVRRVPRASRRGIMNPVIPATSSSAATGGTMNKSHVIRVSLLVAGSVLAAIGTAVWMTPGGPAAVRADDPKAERKAPALDAEKIGQAAGTKATTTPDGVVRLAWARTDVAV